MLSYQHEFHAGNHADCLKHVALLALLNSLVQKQKPFTVIDSHSSSGTFSLDDERLLKTGESLNGIKRLLQYADEHDLSDAVSRYVKLERQYAEQKLYAGSATLVRHYLREGDAHFAVELHPSAYENLCKNIKEPLIHDGKTVQAKAKTHAIKQDSYKALLALCPPLIKRGLVLVDPSYEDTSDYESVCRTLEAVHKKWNTAIIAVWYPLLLRRKNETAQMLAFLETVAKTGLQPVDCVRTELCIKPKDETLYGSGMFVLNPPWKYDEEMTAAVSDLQNALSL